jgi:hypothetical protein
LKRKLDQINLTEEHTENILMQTSIYCFQEGIEIEESFVYLDEVTQIANNLDTSIYEIPEIIEKRKLEVAEVVEQISSTTRKISRLELDCETTKKDFKEYEKTRPLADRIKQLECELKERDRIMIL